MKIMVVDDSSAMRMMIIRALRQSGISGANISQAGDGAEALDTPVNGIDHAVYLGSKLLLFRDRGIAIGVDRIPAQ